MDSVSSSSSSTSSSYRPTVPSLDAFPDEVFLNIISFIDKADNKTLASLASTSKDCWRLVGVDALCSYFHAAHNAFSYGSIEDKSAILPVMIDWLQKVADQLPADTINNMWDHLISMTNTAELKPQDKFNNSSKILDSVKSLFQEELKMLGSGQGGLNPEKINRMQESGICSLVQKAAFCFSNAQAEFDEQIMAKNKVFESRISDFF